MLDAPLQRPGRIDGQREIALGDSCGLVHPRRSAGQPYGKDYATEDDKEQYDGDYYHSTPPPPPGRLWRCQAGLIAGKVVIIKSGQNERFIQSTLRLLRHSYQVGLIAGKVVITKKGIYGIHLLTRRKRDHIEWFEAKSRSRGLVFDTHLLITIIPYQTRLT